LFIKRIFSDRIMLSVAIGTFIKCAWQKVEHKKIYFFVMFYNYYRSPIALGYTRGHFSALVPPEPDPGCGGGAGGGAAPPTAPQCCYLPLVSRDLAPLPLHFLSRSELGREEELLKQWLDVGLTESGEAFVSAVDRAEAP
jgi:hypothetical protein